MEINVTKDIVKILTNDYPHENEYKIRKCYFTFDEFTDSFEVKRAIFTSLSTGLKKEIDIIDNECDIPVEILQNEYDTVKLGVYSFDIETIEENGEEKEVLKQRTSPSYDTFTVPTGSYEEGAETPEPITPSQYDIYSQKLQEGLDEVEEALQEVENVNIDVQKVDHTATVTITDRYGEDKSVDIYDGDTGEQGPVGPPGQDAKINGYNTITIQQGTNIGLTQEGSTLTINNTYDDSAILQDISDLQTNKADKSEIPTKVSQLDNDSGYIDKNVDDLTNYTPTNELSAVATSGSYNDLEDKPDLSVYATTQSLNDEISNRQIADNNLQGQIDAITSSSDVKDIVGTYQDLLEYDTSTLGNDDIIKVLEDSTHNDAMTYYRWVISGSSGSWQYIGQEGPYYTKSQANELLSAKVGFTDYATGSTGGVIKTSTSTGTSVSSSGILQSVTRTYANYQNDGSSLFVSKGTLENVITGKGLVSNTDYATTSTGGVVIVNGYGLQMINGNLRGLGRTYEQYQSSSDNLVVAKGTLENVIAGKELTNKTYVDNGDSALENELSLANEEIDRLKLIYNAMPKVTGTGESVTLNNTAKCPMETELGSTELSQDTTTGANLMKFNARTYSGAGITYKCDDIGQVTATGTSTGLTLGYNLSNNLVSLEPGTYVLDVIGTREHVTFKYNGSNISIPFTFTIASATNVLIEQSFNQNSTYNVDYYITLAKDTATTERYTGGQPQPNPSYPSQVHSISGDNTLKIEGKNLFDKSKVTYGYTSITSGREIVGNDYISTDYIKVEPLQTYYSNYVSFSSSAVGVTYYDENKVFISGTALPTNNKITPSSNIYYIRIAVRNPEGTQTTYTTDINTMYVVKGTTATTYEPYQGQEYPITLPVENLFDKDNVINNCYLGETTLSSSNGGKTLFASIKPNTTYTISKIASTRFSVATTNEIPAIGSTIYNRTQNNSAKSITITTDNNSKYLVCFYYNPATDTLTEQQILDSIQIEEGTKANTYSEYGTTPIEYCKIGNYKDEFIKNSGKNLFDKDSVTTYAKYINVTTGELTTESGSLTISMEVSSLQGKTITISKITTNRFRYAFYTSDTFGSSSLIDSVVGLSNDATIGTTIIPSNATYMCIQLKAAGSSMTDTQCLDSVMINEGSTALPYEPYGNGDWYLKKNIGKVVLNGSESWSLNGGSAGANANAYTTVISSAISVANTNNEVLAKSNYWQGKSANETVGTWILNTISVISNNRLYVTLNRTDYSSATDLQTWLSTHNTIVYYVLATPTYILLNNTLQTELNNIEKAISYQNQTNVSQINNDLPFTLSLSAIRDLSNIFELIENQ